jgi:hypothetical protein
LHGDEPEGMLGYRYHVLAQYQLTVHCSASHCSSSTNSGAQTEREKIQIGECEFAYPYTTIVDDCMSLNSKTGTLNAVNVTHISNSVRFSYRQSRSTVKTKNSLGGPIQVAPCTPARRSVFRAIMLCAHTLAVLHQHTGNLP